MNKFSLVELAKRPNGGRSARLARILSRVYSTRIKGGAQVGEARAWVNMTHDRYLVLVHRDFLRRQRNEVARRALVAEFGA